MLAWPVLAEPDRHIIANAAPLEVGDLIHILKEL
jgi:hypothetical protein